MSSGETHRAAARIDLARPSRGTWLLFATLFIRLFAYGALSVVLVFYLIGVGLTAPQTGLLLTLLGNTVVSLWLAPCSWRRPEWSSPQRETSGSSFLAATVGVVTPSGQEVGPFLPIEQAALTRMVSDRTRTDVFARYTLTGALATALGALVGGLLTAAFQSGATPLVSSYRSVVILYAALGVVLAGVFSLLSRETEPAVISGEKASGQGIFANLTGVERSRQVVVKLSGLFALDAFGGGFGAQSFAAYWFHLRFGVDPATLGPIFFWANLLAGLSALLASRMAAQFGLVRTMVWTHLPSNILLILLTLMPTLPLAVDRCADTPRQRLGQAGGVRAVD